MSKVIKGKVKLPDKVYLVGEALPNLSDDQEQRLIRKGMIGAAKTQKSDKKDA
jgi:hypothetical protein